MSKDEILVITRKIYETMSKTMPDLGKKNNFLLMTVNAKASEWNGDMSVGVAMTDGDFDTPMLSHKSFDDIKKVLRGGGSMKVLILFTCDMVFHIVQIISHEQRKQNAKAFRMLFASLKESSVFEWDYMDHVFKIKKVKTPSGKFVFVSDSPEAMCRTRPRRCATFPTFSRRTHSTRCLTGAAEHTHNTTFQGLKITSMESCGEALRSSGFAGLIKRRRPLKKRSSILPSGFLNSGYMYS